MAGLVTIQGKIATTGTAQQLPSNIGPFQSLVITAKSTNTEDIAVTVLSNSGNTDGTGTGYILEKGTSLSVANLSNSSAIWVNGTGGDIYSVAAN